jgi:acyl dehydratase
MIEHFETAKLFSASGDLDRSVGEEVCVSTWTQVTQKRIDLFAAATGDHQWIHVDQERAKAESPYGGTIAHGFLTLSLLGQFYEAYLSTALPFYDMGLNYGLGKVRFTHPVREGSLVRCRLRLLAAQKIQQGHQLTFGVTIEIDGVDRPACVAESIVRRLSSGAGREA